MAILKIDVIESAYSQIRISGLSIKPRPEEVEAALFRLESMMAELDATNLRLGYQFEDEPDPNTDTGVSIAHLQMMATNLAMRMLSDFGKAIPPSIMIQASQSLSNSNSIVAAEQVGEVPYPNRQPRGSGNTVKFNRWFRYYKTDNSPPAGSNIIVQGDTQDYVEFYDSYLIDGDEIDTYTIEPDTGLTLVSDSNTADQINYRLTADDDKSIDPFRQVKIIVDTTNGRQVTRLIDFDIRCNQTVGDKGT